MGEDAVPVLPNNCESRGTAAAEPDIQEHDVDILLLGGGMGNCGAAVEAARWAAEHAPHLKILMVDRAAVERSGAVAQGLSAINTYLGRNSVEDYVRMVRADLMQVLREDLVYDLGRHVDDSVHLFEDWGLPCKIRDGDRELDGIQAAALGKSLRNGDEPVRSGRWQIMINGESFKRIVAEAAGKALGRAGVMEHIYIVKLLRDARQDNRIAGAAGFSLRENRVHIFRANAVVVACGGAVNLFRPRSSGEGMGRAWYPVWNAGTTYAVCAEAGAEMTMMESRFVPVRFKDGYGPVGAWFLLFKAKGVNSAGEDYVERNQALLQFWRERGYAGGRIIPSCLRNHLLLHEVREGRGPVYMDTPSALASAFAGLDEERRRRLEEEAWEDFLDMCVAQAGLWAAMNVKPEEQASEIMPTEPYLLGSHSGCCGLWVSGPDEDWVPEEYKIRADNGKVYNRMSTVNGLFTCADGVGASGHKFSSGSHAEGRIVGKQLVRWCVDHKGHTPVLRETPEELKRLVYRPWRTFVENRHASTDPAVNPRYISPKNFMLRLNKCMDEYGGGVSTLYTCSGASLRAGLKLLEMLEEDAEKLAARDLHELLRCWENRHRLRTAYLHLRHLEFRKETRYPGFCYRTDCPDLNDAEWHCFVNSRHDPASGKTALFRRPCLRLIADE
jgi:adenylylsulfate reductase subunit A